MSSSIAGDGGCEYCSEFNGGPRRPWLDAQLGVASRLRAKGSVVAFPTVSPLVEGHVLIAPRRHVCSTQLCAPRETADLDNAVFALARLLLQPSGTVAVFEHGVGESGDPGCGVDHAHLHLLPLSTAVVNSVTASLQERLPELGSGPGPRQNLLRGLTPGAPYVLFGSTVSARLFDGSGAPSQLVRRLLAEELRVEWDWRAMTNTSGFRKTLNLLQAA